MKNSTLIVLIVAMLIVVGLGGWAVGQRRITVERECLGNRYNCADFSSCDEVWDYFLGCPGDPSYLDGDKDGFPCESRCN